MQSFHVSMAVLQYISLEYNRMKKSILCVTGGIRLIQDIAVSYQPSGMIEKKETR